MDNILLCGVVYSVVILFLVVSAQALAGIMNNGFSWGLGARDTAKEPTVFQGRAQRTVNNHTESMLFFVPLALVAYHMGLAENAMVIKGVWLYLIGRAIYPLTYWTGLPYARTLIWAVSVVGIVMLLLAIFGMG